MPPLIKTDHYTFSKVYDEKCNNRITYSHALELVTEVEIYRPTSCMYPYQCGKDASGFIQLLSKVKRVCGLFN